MAAIHDENTIRALAYQLWEARGRRDGDPERDWMEAERRLKSQAVDRESMDSFPASDSPGSHLPDEPPVNAEAKFAAARAAASQEATVRDATPRSAAARDVATRVGEQQSARAPKIATSEAPGG